MEALVEDLHIPWVIYIPPMLRQYWYWQAGCWYWVRNDAIKTGAISLLLARMFVSSSQTSSSFRRQIWFGSSAVTEILQIRREHSHYKKNSLKSFVVLIQQGAPQTLLDHRAQSLDWWKKTVTLLCFVIRCLNLAAPFKFWFLGISRLINYSYMLLNCWIHKLDHGPGINK